MPKRDDLFDQHEGRKTCHPGKVQHGLVQEFDHDLALVWCE
jgi:hypothetical protein